MLRGGDDHPRMHYHKMGGYFITIGKVTEGVHVCACMSVLMWCV